MQYPDGLGQFGVQEGAALSARHEVPVQLQVHGPDPETLLGDPAWQSSIAVEGAEDRVAPFALPQTPGERFALQELLPHVHDQPVQ